MTTATLQPEAQVSALALTNPRTAPASHLGVWYTAGVQGEPGVSTLGSTNQAPACPHALASRYRSPAQPMAGLPSLVLRWSVPGLLQGLCVLCLGCADTMRCVSVKERARALGVSVGDRWGDVSSALLNVSGFPRVMRVVSRGGNPGWAESRAVRSHSCKGWAMPRDRRG